MSPMLLLPPRPVIKCLELMIFPAGKNDDQVDVLSLFGRMLPECFKAYNSREDVIEKWSKRLVSRMDEANWKIRIKLIYCVH